MVRLAILALTEDERSTFTGFQKLDCLRRIRWIAEHIPYDSDGETHRPMMEMVTVSTGITNFRDGNPIYDNNRILLPVQNELKSNIEFQNLVNAELRIRFGMEYDFATWIIQRGNSTPPPPSSGDGLGR